ncbi:MAG: High-affinity branched-chain amino acid transport system permease protein LivH, partial [Pseudomonadota bacterium]
VEALVGAIVGGMGTLWGPVVGALTLHVLADVTRNLFGQLPGINMVVYGTVLVLIVMFMPRGISGGRFHLFKQTSKTPSISKEPV